MYRFALRPRWILSHVLVLVLIFGLLSLGFWQLRRFDEKQAANDLVDQRSVSAAVAIEELADPADSTDVGDDLRFRPVTASGTYLVDDTVLVRGRSHAGSPGFWVLTPLDLGDGSAVVVNRGWVPFLAETDGTDVDWSTPSGTVVLEGLVDKSLPGAQPAGDARVTVKRADLNWYRDHVDYGIQPVLIQLLDQDPGQQGDLPIPLDIPALDEGPHLGYAVQWFIFAGIAIVGYPIILRRVAHQKDSPDHER